MAHSFASLKVTRCQFTSNRASVGGAFYLGTGTRGAGGLNRFLDSSFVSNQALQMSGGAVAINYPPVEIDGKHVLFERCVFDSNFAAKHGRAIYNNQAPITLAGSNFTASAHVRAGSNTLALFSAPRVNIVSSTFTPFDDRATVYSVLSAPSTCFNNPCAPGQACTFVSGSRWCTNCPAGMKSSDGLACEACPEGTVTSTATGEKSKAGTAVACNHCARGYYSLSPARSAVTQGMVDQWWVNSDGLGTSLPGQVPQLSTANETWATTSLSAVTTKGHDGYYLKLCFRCDDTFLNCSGGPVGRAKPLPQKWFFIDYEKLMRDWVEMHHSAQLATDSHTSFEEREHHTSKFPNINTIGKVIFKCESASLCPGASSPSCKLKKNGTNVAAIESNVRIHPNCCGSGVDQYSYLCGSCQPGFQKVEGSCITCDGYDKSTMGCLLFGYFVFGGFQLYTSQFLGADNFVGIVTTFLQVRTSRSRSHHTKIYWIA